MTWTIKGKIDGLSDVMKSLEGLKASVGRRILRKAITDATRPILKDAKSKCPRETGLLRKSLGRKTKVYRKSGVVVGIVGPRTGFKQMVTIKDRRTGKTVEVLRNPTKYAHLVEYGTLKAAAKPFLRPAWTGNKSRAAELIATRVREEIAKEAAKAKGK